VTFAGGGAVPFMGGAASIDNKSRKQYVRGEGQCNEGDGRWWVNRACMQAHACRKIPTKCEAKAAHAQYTIIIKGNALLG